MTVVEPRALVAGSLRVSHKTIIETQKQLSLTRGKSIANIKVTKIIIKQQCVYSRYGSS
jgi:hypothetical protein